MRLYFNVLMIVLALNIMACGSTNDHASQAEAVDGSGISLGVNGKILSTQGSTFLFSLFEKDKGTGQLSLKNYKATAQLNSVTPFDFSLLAGVVYGSSPTDNFAGEYKAKGNDLTFLSGRAYLVLERADGAILHLSVLNAGISVRANVNIKNLAVRVDRI